MVRIVEDLMRKIDVGDRTVIFGSRRKFETKTPVEYQDWGSEWTARVMQRSVYVYAYAQFSRRASWSLLFPF